MSGRMGRRGERNKRPKILLLLHELTLTGAPRSALGTFRELAAEMDFMILAQHGGPLEPEFKRLGHFTVLRHQQEPSYELASMARLAVRHISAALRTRSVRRRARRWRPDMVYVNTIHALPQTSGLDLTGVPILLHVHEAPVALAAFDARYPDLIGCIPDRYVAVSRFVAGELTRRYGVPSDRVVIIPPSTDVPEVPAETSGSVDTSGHPFIVGGMGNPSWFKGHVVWLLAARDVVAVLGSDAVRFVWVGVRDNDEGRFFAAMVSKLGLEAVVELVPETIDPLPFLRRFDLLAVSSWEESASLAALEAMAHGIPVVCFAISGGPVELIDDAGEVVPTFSPGAMAEAIVDLASDVPQRRRLGIAARERVVRHYARTTIVRRVAEEINTLVSRGPAC